MVQSTHTHVHACMHTHTTHIPLTFRILMTVVSARAIRPAHTQTSHLQNADDGGLGARDEADTHTHKHTDVSPSEC